MGRLPKGSGGGRSCNSIYSGSLAPCVLWTSRASPRGRPPSWVGGSEDRGRTLCKAQDQEKRRFREIWGQHTQFRTESVGVR